MDTKGRKIHLDCPREIEKFLKMVFCLRVVARKNIGKCGEITFRINSNERNHSVPHIHASCQGYNISIAIENAEVLAGNLPYKQTNIAIKWVEDNRERLINEWENFAFCAGCVDISSGLPKASAPKS